MVQYIPQIPVEPVALTLSWSGPSGFTSVNEDITSLYAGSYTIIATDTEGCSPD